MLKQILILASVLCAFSSTVVLADSTYSKQSDEYMAVRYGADRSQWPIYDTPITAKGKVNAVSVGTVKDANHGLRILQKRMGDH